MTEHSHANRGIWDGIPLDLLKPGISCNDPIISPNGDFLSFTLNLKGEKIFYSKIFNNCSIADLKQIETDSLSTGTPYGGSTYCWTNDSTGFIFSSEGKLQYFSLKTNDKKNLLFDHSNQLAYAPTTSKNYILFSIEQKTTMNLGLISAKKGTFVDQWPQQLNFNANFIYDPQISPDEKHILFHYWNFPNMSWNGSKIALVSLNDLLENDFNVENTNKYTVAGSESIATAQPRFSPDGKYISFLNEESGWLNIWIANKDGSDKRQLFPENKELSYSTWVTGGSSYTWLPNGKELVFSRNSHGSITLSKINVETHEITDLPLSTGWYSDLRSSSNSNNSLITALFSNYNTKQQVLIINPYTEDLTQIANPIFTSTPVFSENLKNSLIEPEVVSFPTSDKSTAHGLLYLAPDTTGKKEDAPIIMFVHGGPTGMSSKSYNSIIHYLATRGYAVFAINHRGSVGYGKTFRELLNTNWGKYDVEDTVDALDYLASQNIINKQKSCILGGSAGGFTVLMSLVKKPGIYSAGVDLFGVSDNFGLAEETHYLESHYTDTLLGPLPEASQKYFEESAIFHPEKIIDPLIIFQGAKDKVVPKNQSLQIKSKVQGYVEYHEYEEEGHGFRRPETYDHMMPIMEKFLMKYVLYGIANKAN